ncbi:hypothetical protein DVK00_02830 [Haloarcula sp. Atlit-47R]|uniref:hypothetical protein n=1 Tax=Haloarcula sp. Atlit-47R TaxID=2282132 RepID=UPI000EF1D8F5|nr:hypothetical protein [Haloarcula sp. Atlit-47R]RLM47459.1 hypothetical protein DVK00_02830 [Haloarcula sp. Atlit-47R]
MVGAGLVDDLATALGKSTDDAARIIDDIGESRARQLADAGDGFTDSLKTAGKYGLLGGAGLGIYDLGSGYLDAEQAASEASEAADESQTISDILSSEFLTADQKRELVDKALDAQKANNSGSGSDNGLNATLDKATMLIIGIVLLAVFLQFGGGD